ncbi:MAG: glucose-6-phosphate dehydrogenase assembly protein OpcA [Polyangiaceae bacterium]
MTTPAVGSHSGAVSDAVAHAEAKLASFWSAPQGTGDAARVKVRASTLNYVVLCAPQDADAYREASERLSDTHGGRTLLLTMSGRIAAWDLVPEIHAVCRIDGAEPVCYDRVDLTFGAVAASRAASVVRALALPELPTVVEVAAGAPQPLIDTVAGKFDRLIVDSARMPVASLARVVQRATCPVADRAMVRTYAWRELTARFFDDAAPALQEIRRVELSRTASGSSPAGGGGTQDPAPLFLGWLASRLGWTFVSREAARDARGQPVELVVTEDPRVDAGPGQLTLLRLHTSLGGAPLDCSLERIPGAAAAHWRLRGARTADREHALGFKDETWVAVKAIDAREGDAVTRAALLAAAAWDAARAGAVAQ